MMMMMTMMSAIQARVDCRRRRRVSSVGRVRVRVRRVGQYAYRIQVAASASVRRVFAFGDRDDSPRRRDWLLARSG